MAEREVTMCDLNLRQCSATATNRWVPIWILCCMSVTPMTAVAQEAKQQLSLATISGDLAGGGTTRAVCFIVEQSAATDPVPPTVFCFFSFANGDLKRSDDSGNRGTLAYKTESDALQKWWRTSKIGVQLDDRAVRIIHDVIATPLPTASALKDSLVKGDVDWAPSIETVDLGISRSVGRFSTDSKVADYVYRLLAASVHRIHPGPTVVAPGSAEVPKLERASGSRTPQTPTIAPPTDVAGQVSRIHALLIWTLALAAVAVGLILIGSWLMLRRMHDQRVPAGTLGEKEREFFAYIYRHAPKLEGTAAEQRFHEILEMLPEQKAQAVRHPRESPMLSLNGLQQNVSSLHDHFRGVYEFFRKEKVDYKALRAEVEYAFKNLNRNYLQLRESLGSTAPFVDVEELRPKLLKFYEDVKSCPGGHEDIQQARRILQEHYQTPISSVAKSVEDIIGDLVAVRDELRQVFGGSNAGIRDLASKPLACLEEILRPELKPNEVLSFDTLKTKWRSMYSASAIYDDLEQVFQPLIQETGAEPQQLAKACVELFHSVRAACGFVVCDPASAKLEFEGWHRTIAEEKSEWLRLSEEFGKIRHRVLELLYEQGDEGTEDIQRATESLCKKVGTARASLKRAGVPDGTIERMAEEVASKLRAGEELTAKLSSYIGLGDVGDHKVLDILNADTEIHRQLRLALAAALTRKEIFTGRNGATERIFIALNTTSIPEALGGLLANLKGDRDLWSDVIGRAFGVREGSLQSLFRAELLLQTYFADHDEFSDLRDAVSLACSSIRLAMRATGWGVEPIRLLAQPPSGAHKGDMTELSQIEEVRTRVRQAARNGDYDLAVDVKRFRLQSGERLAGSCEVVIATPALWG